MAAPGDWSTCTCGHWASDHIRRTGRCREKDSYRLPCDCRSFERDPDGIGEDPPLDADWNQFEPDGKGG